MRIKLFKYTLTAALLSAAVLVCAQNQSAGINLSLWNKISTQPYNENQRTYINLGIQSKQNKLDGVSINLLGSHTLQNVKGIQLAGLSTISGESVYGLQVAGLVSLSSVNANGLSLSGLINIVGESQHGVMVSGALNLIGIDTKGVTLAGLANLGGYNSEGLAIAGLVNAFKEDVKGVSIAGLMQLSENTKGVSIAPLNLNSGQYKGVQLGLLNIGHKHQGLQLGLVNYYKEQMSGLQLGLINVNKNTKYDLLMYGGNQSKINLAVRFRNRLFYNVIGVGSPYLGFGDHFSGALNYRTGVHYPVSRNFELSTDLGYSHINTFANKNKQKAIPRRLYSLAYRLNAEYIPIPKWSVFFTTGYATTRWYSQSRTHKKGFILEAGISHRLYK